VTAPSLRELPLRVLPRPLLRTRRPALGGRGSAHLIERHARVYRHAWLVLVSGIFEPLFYLLSIGVGIGHLVGGVTGPGGQVVGYPSFVAPALLATAAMNGAIYDSTFNVFFRLKYAKFYDAALATPMRPGDIALGEIGWALIRGGLYAVAFGSAAAGMAATTFMRSWQDFEFITLATLPMFLLSATFYPLSVYPRPVQIVVECTPLYQGVALMRGLTLGVVGPGLLWHAAYLALMGLAGLWVASGRIGRLLLQ